MVVRQPPPSRAATRARFPFLAAFFAVLAAAAALPAAPAHAEMPSLDALVRQFEATAFKAPKRSDWKYFDMITKWRKRELRLGMNDTTTTAPELRNRYPLHTENALGQLSRASGLSFTYVSDDLDIQVEFRVKDEFNDYLVSDGTWTIYFGGDVPCATRTELFWYGQPGYIVGMRKGPEAGALAGAITAIDAQADVPTQLRCLYKHLYQSLGLTVSACHYRPSILCKDDAEAAYSDADILLLRALYDPRLHSEMKPQEAMPIARQVIAELRAEAVGR